MGIDLSHLNLALTVKSAGLLLRYVLTPFFITYKYGLLVDTEFAPTFFVPAKKRILPPDLRIERPPRVISHFAAFLKDSCSNGSKKITSNNPTLTYKPIPV